VKHTGEAQFVDIAETESARSAETVRLAVIVPAYRPEASLLQLICALSEKPIPAIVVVDDGSGPDYREIFRLAAQFPKVRLVRHAINLGKGAALKSGINYALCAFPGLQGVVTADGDGQHHPDDIEQVAGRLAEEPDRVVLGTRKFSAAVPLRSRVGNAVTRVVMRAMLGENVSDTQTGLRGIPARLLPSLLRLEANGYDFELDMLIAARQQALPIAEVPIRTIYEPGNRTSHFNPLTDSMKIYFVLLRFSSVSLMTAALDTLVFYLAYRRLGNVAASQALGRLAAVAFNYSLVRRAVFFSKLRHVSVLPKYLLLVCVSGAASYAGIQLLNTRFHVQLLPAKLVVETLLFFANFAIQRDFIFGKPPGDFPRRTKAIRIRNVRVWIPHAVLAAAAIVLLGVVLHGFRADRQLWANSGWSPLGRFRLIHYTKIFWTGSLAILLTVPSAFAPIVAVLIVAATAVAIGPIALLGVAAFLIASCALGLKLLGAGDSSPEDQLCATLLGIAVYIFLMTFLVRLPVNYPAVYVILLAIPVLTDIRGVGRRLVSWGNALVRSRRPPRTQVAALMLLVFVLGMHWLIVPQPESSGDGLAMHLAIPVDIAQHHIFTYRPGHILWSVMPMGADWCYTMVYLLGGEYAARLLNFAMLLLVEALLYRAVRRFVSPAIGFVILALFASSSLVQLVTGSLFIENFLAAMIVGMAMAIWQFGDTGQKRYLYAAAVLGGTALATKIGGMAYVAVALPVAAIEVRRQWGRLRPRPALSSGIAAALLLAAALPAYAISWWMTGDPVYPFLNRQFPSPLVDRAMSFVDTHYTRPIAFSTPYDLTFHSNLYCEGRPGYLGFHYLLLAPLGLIALLAVRPRPALSAAVLSIGGSMIVFKFLPNARYLYPALPLMLVPLAALLSWLAPGILRRALIALAVACVALNAWFLPSSSAYHSDFYEQAPLSRGMRQVYIHKYAPMREAGQYMNRTHPGAAVFLADGSQLSAFNADVYSNGWHEYNVLARIWRAHSPLEIAAILDGWNVHYIVAPKPDTGIKIEPPALKDLLDKCVTPEYQTTSLFVARIEKNCNGEPLTVQPGVYDDFDFAVVFHGPWIRDKAWSQTYSHTITYSNVPGSEAHFAFHGSALTYVYTKASNRGRADIVIDGIHRGILDLYSRAAGWQSRSTFKLGAGQHLAVITVLQDKNPESAGRFIDVDAFEVQ
jgi:glycosyltransferase involved in cell wall biosynthesis